MISKAKNNVYKSSIRLLLLVFVLSCLILYGTYIYKFFKFYLYATPEFEIVKHRSSFVPQGIDYIEDEDTFVISGYDFPSGYTSLIVIDSNEQQYTKKIINEKGEQFKWHSGGVAVHGDYVYVTGGNKKCYVIYKDDLLDKSTDTALVIGKIKTHSNSSFCFDYGNCLFIGEYEYKARFTTDTSHHKMTKNGTINTAMVFAYPFTEDGKYGVAKKPALALSIGSSVQGMCMDRNGLMYLSCSNKYEESSLYIYDFDSVLKTVDYTFDVDGSIIPVHMFEDDALIRKINLPPNSEGITTSGDDLYIIFESASKKFKYGYLFFTQYAYSINVDKLTTVLY